MKSRLIEKNQAIELRKSGQSYGEIAEKLKVSKGLLSGWLKNFEFSSEEISVIKTRGKDRQSRGRMRAAITNKFKRMEREKVAFETGKKKFSRLKNESQFLVGISLYWVGGSKQGNGFQFVHSDPDSISFLYGWIEKYLGIEKSKIKLKLFAQKGDDLENLMSLWANLLGRESGSFEKTVIGKQRKTVKNPDYRGSLSLSVLGIGYLRLMKAWQKLLTEYLLK